MNFYAFLMKCWIIIAESISDPRETPQNLFDKNLTYQILVG